MVYFAYVPGFGGYNGEEMIEVLAVIFAGFFIVGIVHSWIQAWERVRRYECEKHYDETIAMIASNENCMRPMGDLQRAVAGTMKGQHE